MPGSGRKKKKKKKKREERKRKEKKGHSHRYSYVSRITTPTFTMTTHTVPENIAIATRPEKIQQTLFTTTTLIHSLHTVRAKLESVA